MRAKDLIDEAARFVADFDSEYPFTRWSERNWFDAFRYALSMIAAYRPRDFSHQTSVPLVPGSRQTLPSSCDGLVAPLEPMRETSRSASALVKGRPSCRAEVDAGNYSPDSYQTLERDSRAIYLQPPAPDGVTGTLDIICYAAPDPASIDEDVDVHAWYRAPILDFMLWYAFGFDTESVASRDRAEAHYKAAVSTLTYRTQTRLDQRQEDRLQRESRA